MHEPEDPQLDLERVRALVAALEHDLARAARGSADLTALRREVDSLKSLLDSRERHEGRIRTRLQALRSRMERALEKVEGEAIRDWPYVAEIGRMLGMQ